MIAVVFLPLQEGVGQHGGGKYDQWHRYLTDHVVIDGIIKSITIYSAVGRLVMKLDIDTPRDTVHQQLQSMLPILQQLSTLSGLDLDHVHHLPHALLQEYDTDCSPDGNQ